MLAPWYIDPSTHTAFLALSFRSPLFIHNSARSYPYSTSSFLAPIPHSIHEPSTLPLLFRYTLSHNPATFSPLLSSTSRPPMSAHFTFSYTKNVTQVLGTTRIRLGPKPL